MHDAPGLIEMMTRLIETPSISSVHPHLDQGNRSVIELLAGWLDGLGFETEIQTVDKSRDTANLIATLGSGPGGLVLSGHADTVPFDEQRWQRDPFRLTDADQRLYGLGTADMKCFLALAIDATRELRADQLREPLIIIATADEESSMTGAKALAAAGRPGARHAIIGEPTGLRPIRMHKGIFMESIRLTGQAGHSSDPRLGNSALDGMQAVLSNLLAWRNELQQKHAHPGFEIPEPTLNLGHIHGGDNPNRICGECELQIDLRPLPGMDIDELRAILHQRVRQSIADSGLDVDFNALFDGVPAVETPATAAIVREAERATGFPAESAAFGTEAPYLTDMGIQTVVLGPGDIDQAHQPDEYLSQERIAPTIELLQQLVNRFCVHPDTSD